MPSRQILHAKGRRQVVNSMCLYGCTLIDKSTLCMEIKFHRCPSLAFGPFYQMALDTPYFSEIAMRGPIVKRVGKVRRPQ